MKRWLEQERDSFWVIVIVAISFVLMNIGYLRTIRRLHDESVMNVKLYESCLGQFEFGGAHDRDSK